MSDRVLMSGWGGRAGTVAQRRAAASADDVTMADHGGRGAIVRGLGRSYGDAAQNAGGTVWDLRHLDGIALDVRNGLVTVGGGAPWPTCRPTSC